MQEDVKLNRKILKEAFAKTLKELRIEQKKSITLISNEINLSKTIWADAENGIVDVQFSTFWRISEALDISPEECIKKIKTHLPGKFSFLEN